MRVVISAFLVLDTDDGLTDLQTHDVGSRMQDAIQREFANDANVRVQTYRSMVELDPLDNAGYCTRCGSLTADVKLPDPVREATAGDRSLGQLVCYCCQDSESFVCPFTPEPGTMSEPADSDPSSQQLGSSDEPTQHD